MSHAAPAQAHAPGSKAAELVALSMAVKSRELSAAKAVIADGSSTPVRVIAELVGVLARGQGKPATEGTQAAAANLCTYPVLLAVLAQLGIGPARLAAALAHVTEHVGTTAELDQLGRDTKAQRLDQVLAEASFELSGKLPPVKFSRDASAGRLTFDVASLTLHESNPCEFPVKKAA